MGQLHRTQLHRHRGVDVMPVTAGHGDSHRHVVAAQPVEHPAVALGQARISELQPAQAVALVRVGASKVEDQAGRAGTVQLPPPTRPTSKPCSA